MDAHIYTENDKRSGNIPRSSDIFRPEACGNLTLFEVIRRLNKAQRERLVAGYNLKNFARIFEDDELMYTVDSFLEYGMNVSETARNLYMHRNTLIYRLKKIRDETGLDIRNFNMAVTFEMLRYLYQSK